MGTPLIKAPRWPSRDRVPLGAVEAGILKHHGILVPDTLVVVGVGILVVVDGYPVDKGAQVAQPRSGAPWRSRSRHSQTSRHSGTRYPGCCRCWHLGSCRWVPR